MQTHRVVIRSVPITPVRFAARQAISGRWLRLGLLGLCPLALASAQEPAPLSLDALLREIAARSPVVAAETLRAEAMREAIPRAGALDDPQFTLMTEGIPASITGGTPMLRLQAGQMLPWPGKRSRMTRVAERESQVAAARERAVLLDAVTQAKRIYYGLYLNREARRVNREQRAIADTLVDVVTGRLASGMAMHHDVLKMQTEASMLDDELAMLEAERREMVAMLNALRDLRAEEPLGEPLESWSGEVLLDGAALISRALEQRPEVQEMSAMADSKRAMAEVARRAYYPDFMLAAFYDARREMGDTVGAMVTLIPLWISRKQRIDVAVADLRASAAERDRIAMEAMVRAEVEQALARLSRVRRRSEILDTELLDREACRLVKSQRKELRDESWRRMDGWLDGRRDVALDGDRRTGSGPAGRRDQQAVQEIGTARRLPDTRTWQWAR